MTSTLKKAVLQLEIREERIKKKAFVTVSRCSGIASIAMDDKTGKMTIVGEIDVPVIAMKLRKICNKVEIDSVEVVKPLEKKPEPEKLAAPKPPEITAPVPDPYQYQSSYPNPYYNQYPVSRDVDANPCAIM